MKAIEINMPVMREAAGRWYWPGSTSPATVLAFVFLLAAIVYAYQYPAMKAEEATRRLEAINELSMQSVQRTQAAVSRLQALVGDQPEWLRNIASEQASSIQAQLSMVQPLTRDKVLQRAQMQQEQYDKAQRVIELSPFKGLTKKQVPLSIEGRAYLEALEVERPSRFDYQRLSDGVGDALPLLQAAFKLQAQTEDFVYQIDKQLNGDKANQLGPAAATAQGAAYAGEDQQKSLDSSQPAQVVPINKLTSAIRNAEKNAERQQRQEEFEAQRLTRLAEREAEQAERQAQREQQKAQSAAAQRQRDAERQAKAVADARVRQEREAESRRVAAQRQAEAAAEAKRKECTSSLVARAKCAAQGYNPLTGTRN